MAYSDWQHRQASGRMAPVDRLPQGTFADGHVNVPGGSPGEMAAARIVLAGVG